MINHNIHTKAYKSQSSYLNYEKRGWNRTHNYFYNQENSQGIGRLLFKNKTSRNSKVANNRIINTRLSKKGE